MDTGLRIVSIGNFHRYSTEDPIARAFEQLGHSVTRITTVHSDQDSILRVVKDVRPDILLGAKYNFRGADMMDAECASRVVRLIGACRPYIGVALCWHWDCVCPEFSTERWAWQQIIADACDLCALTDGFAARRLPKTCIVRDGNLGDYDETFVPEHQVDACLFVGSLYRERYEWAEVMRQHLGSRFVHVGENSRTGRPEIGIPPHTLVTGHKLTELVRSFRITVQPPVPFFPGYASDRTVQLRSHGALLAAPVVPDYGDGLVPGRHFLPVTLDYDGCARQVAEYLDNYDERKCELVRQAGMRHARSKTWVVRCAELLRHLDNALGTVRISEKGESSVGDEDPTELE